MEQSKKGEVNEEKVKRIMWYVDNVLFPKYCTTIKTQLTSKP